MQLQRLVAACASEAELLKVAEHVRAAKLAELKAEVEIVRFGGRATKATPGRLAAIAVQTEKWTSISAAEIIKKYSR